MKITQSLIDSFASNPSTVTNGRDLALSGKYLTICQTADGMLYFGECAGSGKTPYRCSVDFSTEKPVARCNCPSRQIPCKHCVGLLQAVLIGKKVSIADVPEDIALKRSKREQSSVKKTETNNASKPTEPTEMTKSQRSILIKKIEAQLTGIEVAQQILKNMILSGLGTIDVRMQRAYNAQVKELGNYYIPGVQTAFANLLLTLEGASQERLESAVANVAYLHALLKRGQEYLKQKMIDPCPDIQTNIEERLGRAWKLDELRMYGCVIKDVRIVQLMFNSYDDEAAGQTVEEGIWVCLGDGRLFKTFNYRPFRAVKYIKADDTVFDIVEVPELFIYPGDLNPRIRWEQASFTKPDKKICALIKGFAASDFSTVIKLVKNQLKDPLSDKHPVALVNVHEIDSVNVSDGTHTVIRDESGTQIILRETNYAKGSVRPMVYDVLAVSKGEALLLHFESDVASGVLVAMPLAVVTNTKVIRLLY